MSRFVLLFPLAFLAAPAVAQQGSVPPAASAVPAADPPAVSVPTFPNSTCPIMGKKVSMKLFTDTELGRIYICCKGCDKKIKRDLPNAYKTAYPTTKQIDNASCPVSGEKLGEDAVAVTLQGHAFRVCCAKCVPEAQRNSQVVLVRVTDAKVKDLRNAECPVTGDPVAANAFARVDDVLVRLSSPTCIAAVEKEPAAMRAKAQDLAARKQLPDPRREEPPPPPAAGKEKGATRGPRAEDA